MACPRHDVADDAARLQFKRGKSGPGCEQLQRDRLEIRDPATALSGQCAQHLRRRQRLAELQLHSGASGLGCSAGVGPPGIGTRFGPPHDRCQAQHKAEHEQNQHRPRCEPGRQRFKARLKSRKGVHGAKTAGPRQSNATRARGSPVLTRANPSNLISPDMEAG